MAANSQNVMTSSANNSQKKKENKTARFRWNQGDKVSDLVQCLAQYKSTMEYNNSDFSADKVKQYEAVRQAMAKIYIDKPWYFGPVCITPVDVVNEDDFEEKARVLKQQKDDKDMIKKGYNRVQEKLKEIRQSFSKAVTTGSRSGSGKIVLEHFDQLVRIWGGSPATEPLTFGTNTDEVNNKDDCQNTNIMNTENNPTSIDAVPESNIINGDVSGGEDSNDGMSPTLKRKSVENPVPKLIDNKRKHLERQLSASQRDQILINESKEEAQFKKDIAEAIRQSNQTLGQCMQQMSMSILQVAQGMTRSVEVMSQAMVNQNVQSPYQQPAMPYPSVPSYQYLQMAPAVDSSQQTNNVGSTSNSEGLETINVSQWEQFS